MNREHSIWVEFAGLKLVFFLPEEVQIPKALIPFQINDAMEADAEYRICLLKEPLGIEDTHIAKYGGMKIYPYKQGKLRIYTQLTEKDGCQVACYTNKEQKNVLYYPEKKWEYYSKELNLLHLIGVEELLLQKDAFLLHSSFVGIGGQAVLFSGPSGVGKSTQASLWEKYLKADVLNGDRCIVRKIDGEFYGCGSPWCGTSGIYRREKEPIRGVFILRQAEKNQIRKMKTDAFMKIMQQSIVNAWDSEFVKKLTDLIIELLGCVPVYELACRPDEEAVKMAYETLFGGEV